MSDLNEGVQRGRRAIAIGKQRGLDTSAWEHRLAQLERQALLGWAAEIAEQGQPLPQPVRFNETALRPIALHDAGMLQRYLKEKLKFLALADCYRATGGPGHFPPEWWQAREADTFNALTALRDALAGQQGETQP